MNLEQLRDQVTFACILAGEQNLKSCEVQVLDGAADELRDINRVKLLTQRELGTGDFLGRALYIEL